MHFATASVALGGLALVAAQSTVPEYDSVLDITIDPNSVDPPAMRAVWCGAQTDTCRTLCVDGTTTNQCVESTLEYECLCASNDSAPGLEYYQQTMPTFICETAFGQCDVANTGNAEGQEDCENNIRALCATQSPPDPEDLEEPSSTTTAAPSTTTTGPTDGASNDDGDETDEEMTASDEPGFAAPTLAPAGNGAAAIAAIGMLAYLL